MYCISACDLVPGLFSINIWLPPPPLPLLSAFSFKPRERERERVSSERN